MSEESRLCAAEVFLVPVKWEDFLLQKADSTVLRAAFHFQIHFEQMQSVRSMFEESGRDAPPPSPSKRVSKWDKPKSEPPPPVNRCQEQNVVEELELQNEGYVEEDRDVARETHEKEEVGVDGAINTLGYVSAVMHSNIMEVYLGDFPGWKHVKIWSLVRKGVGGDPTPF